MRDNQTVVDLVAGARDGDKASWDELVERFAPLVWSIARRYGLTSVEAEDVGQNVWLRLIESLHTLREPAAVAGWIVTTTGRECMRAIRVRQRHERELPEDVALADTDAGPIEARLLQEELAVALRDAFGRLGERCQRLLTLLTQEPRLPYGEVGRQMGMPVGSIGPSRARCLTSLRRSPALAAFIEAGAGGGEGGFHV